MVFSWLEYSGDCVAAAGAQANDIRSPPPQTFMIEIRGAFCHRRGHAKA